jgi:WD40 repeat protein
LRLVQPFSLAGYGRDAVAYTPDSGEVAIAGDKVTVANVRDQQGKEVVICKANDGQVAKAVRGFTDPLTAVALSRDGKRLAVGSITGLVHQVDMSNPSQRRALTGHSAEARCVAYAPDGKLLASGGVDATVRLWDPDTGKEVRKLSGHTNVVLCLVFSPDGKTLVTGGADGTVRVWDVATGKEGGVIPPRRPGTMVYALAFTPDGKGLAAACGAEVRQWDIGK